MTKVIVSGGAGFIGQHVVTALLQQGHRVIVIDSLARKQPYTPPDKVCFYRCDITTQRAREIVLDEKPESIVHLAAQIDVGFSERQPVIDAQINILGTINLLESAIAADVSCFVLASSGGAIYGDSEELPTPESAPADPKSPYGVSKLCAELYLRWASRVSNLRTVALRFANVYGPGQSLKGEAGVMTRFAYEMIRGVNPTVCGDGNQTRDFVHVFCVTRAIIQALEQKSARGAYNIASGEAVSINRLVKIMQKMVNYRGKVQKKKCSKQEVIHSQLAINKAIKTFGWRPSMSLHDGIMSLIESTDISAMTTCNSTDEATNFRRL